MSISIIALLTADTKVIENIKPVVKDLVDKSRMETGCIRYDAFVGEKGVTFVEEWTSKEVLNQHEETEHFLALVHEIEKNKLSIEINFVQPLN